MKKIFTLLLVSLLCLSAAACSEQKKSGVTPKPVDGVALAFDDGTDYYSVAPSFIVEDETMYAYYTSNATAKKRDSAIVLRKGTLKNGKWEFGKRQVLLTVSDSGWDAGSVTDADVVKGSFGYEGTTYSYLMAYQGCADKSERNQQIGFALSVSPEGPFVKIPEPVVKYDPAVSGYTWGVGQPSLISEDEAGKIRLYYSVGEELYTYTMTAELDCSDCSDIKGVDGAFMMPIEGLVDGVRNETIFNNAGFARKGETLFVVRDYNPVATIEPLVATAVQLASMPIKDTYSNEGEWTVVDERINALDLMGETDLDGWQRVYSSSVIKDFYGNVAGDSPELALTVTSFDESTREYRYYQGIIIYSSEYDA
ncbi:MAG: hypothetical protein IJY62_02575 [Clostridia bacterium]|nr:hypothetical protein [Clostridia bacterium]